MRALKVLILTAGFTSSQCTEVHLDCLLFSSFFIVFSQKEREETINTKVLEHYLAWIDEMLKTYRMHPICQNFSECRRVSMCHQSVNLNQVDWTTSLDSMWNIFYCAIWTLLLVNIMLGSCTSTREMEMMRW